MSSSLPLMKKGEILENQWFVRCHTDDDILHMTCGFIHGGFDSPTSGLQILSAVKIFFSPGILHPATLPQFQAIRLCQLPYHS